MKKKRKAQKEAKEFAKRFQHELGPWRDTTKERCYTYCSKCGAILTIHVEQLKKYDPTMKWNNGVDVKEYTCPVGTKMLERIAKLKEETMPYEPT